jgi:hypothetical protein
MSHVIWKYAILLPDHYYFPFGGAVRSYDSVNRGNIQLFWKEMAGFTGSLSQANHGRVMCILLAIICLSYGTGFAFIPLSWSFMLLYIWQPSSSISISYSTALSTISISQLSFHRSSHRIYFPVQKGTLERRTLRFFSDRSSLGRLFEYRIYTATTLKHQPYQRNTPYGLKETISCEIWWVNLSFVHFLLLCLSCRLAVHSDVDHANGSVWWMELLR